MHLLTKIYKNVEKSLFSTRKYKKCYKILVFLANGKNKKIMLKLCQSAKKAGEIMQVVEVSKNKDIIRECTALNKEINAILPSCTLKELKFIYSFLMSVQSKKQ